MKHYILISNTDKYEIEYNILEDISNQIKKITNREMPYKELSFKRAYEWELASSEINLELKSFIKDLVKTKKIDCNLIKPIFDRKKKLLLADMDSTIIKEESLNELGKQIGIENKIAKITEKAMNGGIDFQKALILRASLLKGQSTEILDLLKAKIRINDGAEELIKTMNFNGATTVLVSGGFTFLTEYLKTLLNFSFTHANSLEIIEKKNKKLELTGKIKGPILDGQAKLKFLTFYINKNNISHNDTVCVGDGANDIEMVKNANLGVSFKGKEALNKVANINFNHTNLRGVLYAQGYSDKEIM